MSIAKFQAIAIKAVNRWGGAGIIRTSTEATENNGEVVGGVTTSYNVKVATFEYPQNGAGEKSNFNTLILEGDIQAFVLPTDTLTNTLIEVSANNSTIEISGVVWRVVNKKVIAPNSVDIAVYDLHLRK